MQYSLKSKIKDVWQNPVGHDVLSRVLLQMNLSPFLITNPVVAGMSLGTLRKLTRKTLGDGFFKTFIELLASAEEMPIPKGDPRQAWWKEAVFYQIYPRSFMDANGDGVGDLRGIIQKLNYLKALGVDAVWLSPIYDSPNDDNGYDIRDYEKISAEFGTMEDFDELLEGLHNRGMKLIMDLVVNHTSDEHKWFQSALSDPASPYRDYYFLRPSGDGADPPNNWTSFFSGSAWNYYEEQELWGLHLFSKKQMDLNWENPALREDIYAMVRRWLERGVDGFRLDVINYISKRESLPDGDGSIGALMGFYGIEHYFYGPRLHEFLRELRENAFEPFEAFSVGETPGVGMKMGAQLTREDRGELDMVFSFDHLETPGRTRFDDYSYDLNYLKEHLINWTENYGSHCWQSLFYENHDNPRITSKVDPTGRFREPLAKLLAMLQLTLRGTPFIYQGQELGAVNEDFKSIDELRDVESLNLYSELIAGGMDESAAFRKLLAGTRDHARTPMRWDDTENFGFSSKTPWISGKRQSSAAAQEADRGSVLRFYRELISIRRKSKAFIYGEVEFLSPGRKNYFAYTRSLGGESFFIECNLSNKLLKTKKRQSPPILSNYEGAPEQMRAFEARLYRLN